jgi:hypothetical protein
MGEFFDACEDKEGALSSPLVDIRATAIERYEAKDINLMSFIDKANDIPAYIVTMNVHYECTYECTYESTQTD